MREIEILGRHFSNKDVQVRFISNVAPQTDGKEIFLPADMPQKVAPSVLAILLHESYHIKKESSVMEKEIKKLTGIIGDDKLFHEIRNIVEDVRIDKAVFFDYAGARALYEGELRELSSKQAKSPVGLAIALAIVEAEGIDPSILGSCPQEIFPLKEEIVSILKRIPESRQRGTKKIIAEVVKDLYNLLNTYFSKSPQQTSPDSQQEKEEEKNQDKDKVSPILEEGETLILEKGETPNTDEEDQNKVSLILEKGETPNTDEEDQNKVSPILEKGETPNTDEEAERREREMRIGEIIEEVKQQTIGIHQLDRILAEAEKEQTREVKISPAIAKRLLLQKVENRKGSLKINTRKTSSLYTAPTRIFQKTQKKIEKTTIYLVVDISGSMNSPMEDKQKGKREVTEKALYSIVKATTSIPSNKLDLRVLFFNDRVVPGVTQKILQKKFPLPEGGTKPTNPLWEIVRKGKKKARVIMITDAEFKDEDAEETERILKKNPHLDFVGVAIGEGGHLKRNTYLGKKFSIVKRARDLESIFSQVL